MIEKLGQHPKWNESSLASFPELGDNDLHLWWLRLKLNKAQSESALSILSDVQLDKYHRRATAELKHNYLAGRYYLLNLLGAYTSLPASDIELTYGHLNKPRLANNTLDLEFNFTDTDGFGVFVFTKSRQVGVDIENRFREINFKPIAERRFTGQELDFVKQNGDHDQQRCIAIWTRKEAFGKASGVGINFKMNQQNLYADQDNTNSPRYSYDFKDSQGVDWRCLQLEMGDQFIASVVHEQQQNLSLKAFSSFHL